MTAARPPWESAASAGAAPGRVWSRAALPVAEEQAGGVWPLFIGLQIVLLACFLALVGLSGGAGEAFPVTGQPAAALAAAALAAAPPGAAPPGAAPPNGAAQDEALQKSTSQEHSAQGDPEVPHDAAVHAPTAAAFAALLRLLAPERPPGGEALRIAVPAERLFKPGSAALQPAGHAAVAQTAAALADPIEGVPLAASLLLLVAAPPDAGRAGVAAAAALARDRGVAFLGAVVAAGAPPDRIAVGLGQGTPGLAVLSWQLARGGAPDLQPADALAAAHDPAPAGG